jgi:hypothetical protein
MKQILLALLVITSLNSFAKNQETKYRIFFENLKDGDVVSTPVKVKMGVSGYEIKPAGSIAKNEGHHHIIINGTSIEEGKVIPPNDATHIHFGKAQTEAEVVLSPGVHTLTLQLADGAHKSYGPKASATIKITVK